MTVGVVGLKTQDISGHRNIVMSLGIYVIPKTVGQITPENCPLRFLFCGSMLVKSLYQVVQAWHTHPLV